MSQQQPQSQQPSYPKQQQQQTSQNISQNQPESMIAAQKFSNNFDQKISPQAQPSLQQSQQMTKQPYSLSPQSASLNQQQQSLPNGSANIQNGNLNGSGRTQIIHTPASNTGKYKTSICRHYKNGNCQLGSTCHFAHGDVEVRNLADPLPQNIPQQPKVVCNNFKTVKCRYYERGFCKNQNACCFAHGDMDLAHIPYGPGFMPNGAVQGIIGGHMNAQLMPQQPNKITDSILLISILQNLEQVFQTDQLIVSSLQYAQQIAKQGDQKGAFNIISDIMKDPKRTEEEKQLYNTIYTNAQMYYSQQQYINQTMLQSYSPLPGQFIQQVQQDPFYFPQQAQFVQSMQPQVGQKQQIVTSPYHLNSTQLQMQQQQQQQLQNIQFSNSN